MVWIRRDQRRRPHQFFKRLVVLILSMIAAFLLLAEIYPNKFNVNRLWLLINHENYLDSREKVRSFFAEIMTDLNLERPGIESQLLNYAGEKRDYPCFRGLWPQAYPFAWFELRLQHKCDSLKNVLYESIEMDTGSRLVTWLIDKVEFDTLAELVLLSNSAVTPGVSSIAFIFNSLADLKEAEALSLIWLNMPFGFTLTPGQVPAAKLAKALATSNGQCFLELPTSRDEWRLVLQGHKLTKIIRDDSLSSENILAVFKVFPMLQGFCFERQGPPDRQLVQQILNAAEALKLAYIFDGSDISSVDSMAYARGLRIRQFPETNDCLALSIDETRALILHGTTEYSRQNKGIYLLSSSPESVMLIDSLLPLFRKLNIQPVSPLRLAEILDNFN